MVGDRLVQMIYRSVEDGTRRKGGSLEKWTNAVRELFFLRIFEMMKQWRHFLYRGGMNRDVRRISG